MGSGTRQGSEALRSAATAGEIEHRECVIVGGGIAGLAAAADLSRAGLDFILLEAGTFCIY